MDSSLAVTIVISLIAIVPGVLALVNQAKKDKMQTDLDRQRNERDMNKIAQDAAISIIEPLTEEVERLQNRIIELEKALVSKTLEISRLMQEAIEKDTKIRILEFRVEEFKSRLKEFENKGRRNPNIENTDIVDKLRKDLLKIETEKKEEIEQHTMESIKQITNGSTSAENYITEE